MKDVNRLKVVAFDHLESLESMAAIFYQVLDGLIKSTREEDLFALKGACAALEKLAHEYRLKIQEFESK